MLVAVYRTRAARCTCGGPQPSPTPRPAAQRAPGSPNVWEREGETSGSVAGEVGRRGTPPPYWPGTGGHGGWLAGYGAK